MNIAADLIARKMSLQLMNNGIVYNIFCPLEKIVTLMIYYLSSNRPRFKQLNLLGILLVIIISAIGFLGKLSPQEFHTEVYVISGFIISIFSYLHLRRIIRGKAKQSRVIFFFGIANLVYYTLMVSSVSALPVAMGISTDFAKTLFIGNAIAYVMWSILILIGIVWSRTKK